MDIRVSCGDGRVCVSGEMIIQHSAELKPLLLAAVQGGPAMEGIQLDLSGVTEIDTAGLQLLLMLRHEASREARAFSVVQVSGAVRRMLDLCKLRHLLIEGSGERAQ